MRLTTRRLKNIIAEEVKRAARGRRLNEVDQSGVESEAKAALLAQDRLSSLKAEIMTSRATSSWTWWTPPRSELGHVGMPPRYYEG